MSSLFSKNKEKRSRSPSSESNNSFVKTVTSRVSGLLPTTITKWFSSPKSSGNGSAHAIDGSDSSTEDEATDTPVIQQPPAKRMRYSAPAPNFNEYMPPQVSSHQLDTQNNISTHTLLYNTIQSPASKSPCIRESPNYVQHSYMSPNDMCNMDAMNGTLMNSDLTYQSPHIVSATSHSATFKRKSLFEVPVKNSEEEKPLNACEQAKSNEPSYIKQSSYRPALFGSPFYQGRTMYGGASLATYMNNQRNATEDVKKSSENDNNVNMSYSARKVMDLLENYSSPLMEAKRIPKTYKMQELYMPRMASILQLKRRSRLMDTTKAARQIIASHSSTLSGFKPEGDSSDGLEYAANNGPSKIKTRVTRVNQSQDEYKLPEVVNLPTAVLKINDDNLPTFCISPPTSVRSTFPTSTPIQSSCTSNFKPQSGNNNTAISTPNPILYNSATPARGDIFQFASPVTISNHNSPLKNTALPKFTFEDPKCEIDVKKAEKNKPPQSYPYLFNTNNIDSETKTTVITTASGKPTKEWKCPDCMITNKPESDKCVCCGAKQTSGIPVKPVEKCSVCKFAYRLHDADECINCEKARTLGNNSIPLPIPQPADPSKWKCQGCWATNDKDKIKCDYCSYENTKLAKAPSLEKAEPDWKCSDCLILNKSSVVKCVACGGSKQVAKEKPSIEPEPEFRSPFSKPDSARFDEITRAQKAMWECTGCLVRNDKSKTECMCCGMEREGLSKEITPKPYTFPKQSNINFKFGIDPKEQEINIAKTKETVHKMEPTRKLQEPETNNNNVPTFTFTLPNKKVDEKVANILSTDAPKIETSNSEPATSKVPSTPAQSIGNSPQMNEIKPHEELKMSFNAVAEEPSKQLSGFVPSDSDKESKLSFASFPPSSTPLPKSDVKETNINTPPFTTQKAGEQQQTFAFGVPATRQPVTNIFTATADAPSSGFTFGVPQQNAPTTTAAPSVPLFQSSEPSVTPAVNMFANQDSAPAVPTAPAPAAPLFNFGNNASGAAPTTEKSKFNFSFGSGNPESSFSTGLKPVFGSSDNSGATNSFAMLAQPTSQPSNPLGGNELGNSSMTAGFQGFKAPAQKDLWGANSSESSILFSANTSTTQKAAPFAFGSSNPFNASAAPSTVAASSPFGSQSTSAFGMIGSSNEGQQGQGQLFGSAAQASQPTNMFGAQPSAGLFGAPAQPPSFGAPAQTAPTYEKPAPAPAFNFGAPQPSGVFGFGAQQQQLQQQQQQQQQLQQQQLQQQQMQQQQLQQQQLQQQQQQQQQMQPSMYSFGAGMNQGIGGGINPGMSGGIMSQPMGAGMMNQPMAGGMGVQFNIGSAPTMSVRRVRKAIRRNPQR